ncbi:transposase [Endozoicomonas sp. SCSIO W0465]|uniref:transposase n=1 Tax=Endozoicomonas sp. SCSIO W0465 TaxID=2918516 RepID=UPI0035319D68
MNSYIEATVTLANARQQGQCLLADDADKWQADVDHLLPLVDAIVSQTERRVFKGEKVPAQEKVVSLYEPHTDIIVKDRRQVQYGHKLNLVQGKSRLILDLVIEEGNPADSDQFIPMMERQKEIYGRVPRQTSGDGGYACRANLEKAKAMGISDVAFNKKRGLEVEEMTKSQYVYKTLFRFRAGIEAGISWLKRCFGLSRCHCKGSERFDSHCWLSVVCYNLVILARHPAPS